MLCYNLAMKRLGRWLFNFAAVVSGGLLILAIALYVRSFVEWDEIRLVRLTDAPTATYETTYGVSQSRGTILFCAERETTRHPNSTPIPQEYHWVYLKHPVVTVRTLGSTWQYGGIGFGVSGAKATNAALQGKDVFVPHWAIVLLASVLPIAWLARRRFSAAPSGYCTNCGYDLRATPTRCPECGAIPRPAKGLAK
jgi:hypothetical protein